jgi:hypothetical protein
MVCLDVLRAELHFVDLITTYSMAVFVASNGFILPSLSLDACNSTKVYYNTGETLIIG